MSESVNVDVDVETSEVDRCRTNNATPLHSVPFRGHARQAFRRQRSFISLLSLSNLISHAIHRITQEHPDSVNLFTTS